MTRVFISLNRTCRTDTTDGTHRTSYLSHLSYPSYSHYLNFSVAREIMANMIAMIQNRTTTLVSFQPDSSK